MPKVSNLVFINLSINLFINLAEVGLSMKTPLESPFGGVGSNPTGTTQSDIIRIPVLLCGPLRAEYIIMYNNKVKK